MTAAKRGILAGAVAAAAATGAVLADRRVRAVRRAGVASLDLFAAPEPDRAGFVRADDGVQLYYEEDGPVDAPLTVVLLHGFCQNHDDLLFQRRAIRDRFGTEVRVLSVDLRSHGRSQRGPAHSASIDQLGADLAAVLAERAPGPVVLVGHSMGGMTILALADAHPELFVAGGPVRAVALLGTSAGKLAAVSLGVPAGLAKLSDPILAFALRGAKSRVAFVERGRARVTDLAWVFVQRLAFGSQVDPALVEFITRMIGATPVDVIAEFYPALFAYEKEAALKYFADIPVAIICGENDLIAPVEHSEKMADAVPGAELVVIPGAGHQAHMERPDMANDAVLRLIGKALG
jgi:pimeloyl-ACP methyl ester carboxylesterase